MTLFGLGWKSGSSGSESFSREEGGVEGGEGGLWGQGGIFLGGKLGCRGNRLGRWLVWWDCSEWWGREGEGRGGKGWG